jgi:hypothetical protein
VGSRRTYGEETVYERADGRWAGEIRLPDGKRKTVYAKTERDARRKLAALRRKLELGMPVQRDERATLTAYLTD